MKRETEEESIIKGEGSSRITKMDRDSSRMVTLWETKGSRTTTRATINNSKIIIKVLTSSKTTIATTIITIRGRWGWTKEEGKWEELRTSSKPLAERIRCKEMGTWGKITWREANLETNRISSSREGKSQEGSRRMDRRISSLPLNKARNFLPVGKWDLGRWRCKTRVFTFPNHFASMFWLTLATEELTATSLTLWESFLANIFMELDFARRGLSASSATDSLTRLRSTSSWLRTKSFWPS